MTRKRKMMMMMEMMMMMRRKKMRKKKRKKRKREVVNLKGMMVVKRELTYRLVMTLTVLFHEEEQMIENQNLQSLIKQKAAANLVENQEKIEGHFGTTLLNATIHLHTKFYSQCYQTIWQAQ